MKPKSKQTSRNLASASALNRRDLMKLGAAGVALTSVSGSTALAQNAAKPASATPDGNVPYTSSGYVNNANRISGNGPMDGITRQIVEYASSINESVLTDSVLHAVNRAMVDTMAAMISGFESEPARICARLARAYSHKDMKCTMMGYGITTTPELATFANGTMIRHTDFNDIGPGNHTSDNIAGCLAVGEAVHATGKQVAVAIVLAYEIAGSLAMAGGVGPLSQGNNGGWDDQVYLPATAAAVSKLMGLDEDRMANAISLAVVPHMPMSVTHVGALSHWKACRASENTRHGVWAAIMAREGMTGPCQPYEARDGYFDHVGQYRALHIPLNPNGQRIVEMMGTKRTPTEGSSQAALELIPQIRQWTKVNEIESIRYEMPFGNWQEIADPPKFDPRNRETADHSMPYMLARAIMDGEIYLNSFTKEKYTDPACRALMAKMKFYPNAEWTGNAPARITIRKTTGEEKSWDSFNGVRHSPQGQVNTPMTDDEINSKFERVSKYFSIDSAQQEQARKNWENITELPDIGRAIGTLAKFGKPQPL